MGSSPLTRGKRQLVDQCQEESGLIPAHAGKTLYVNIEGYVWRAHPRSRGENTHGGSQFSTITGSSPLTRGKPRPQGRQARRQGLIPAHAGKTATDPARPSTEPAHPRSRGENISPIECMSSRMGSSPLTRGKLIQATDTVDDRGLIPAHAGKTHCYVSPFR